MKDPVRLVADPSCPEGQRALLRHGATLAPPPDAEDRVWRGLAGALGAAALAAGAAGVAAQGARVAQVADVAAAAARATTKLKIAVLAAALVALVGLVALGGRLFGEGPGAPAGDTPPAPAVAPAPAPVAAPASGQPSMPVSAAAAVTSWATTEAPPASRVRRRRTPRGAGVAAASPPAETATETTTTVPASRLRQETTLIKEARQALRAGDPAGALRVLEECRRLFPAGILAQERERLAVEALARSGRAAEAAARAAAFLRTYPDSPHAGEVRALGLEAKRTP